MSNTIKVGEYELKPGDHWFSVYCPIAGWKWVEYWINPDMGGFVEPWITSPFAFASKEQAIREGKAMAEFEGLPFIYKE